MDTNSMSPADIKSIMGGDGFGSNGLGWLILLFLFFGFGNGGFGKTSSTDSALTRADLNDGFNHQAVIDKLGTIGTSITDSTYTLNNAINNGVNSINSNIVSGFNSSQSDMIAGFNSVNSSITALSNQLSSCCCELKSQMLQDKYDNVARELTQAQGVISNQTQTQNILNTIGRYGLYAPVFPNGGVVSI